MRVAFDVDGVFADMQGALRDLATASAGRPMSISLRRGWHVVFLTQRPRTAGDHPQIQTQRWIARRGFDHASVLIVPGDRGTIAAALNLEVVVDDVPAFCLDVQLESRAVPCLVWRRDASELPPGTRRLSIEVFFSAGTCLDYLESRDAAPLRAQDWAYRCGTG